MEVKLRELEGGLMMNDGLREFGERCYKAGRMDVVEWIHEWHRDVEEMEEWESQKKVWFNEKK